MELTNVPLFGMTNQIPAFSLTNIPVYVNSQFVYSSAAQRVLQLAANIYDASSPILIIRPFSARCSERMRFGNIFVTGYTNLNSGYHSKHRFQSG